jgi:hypothetical protein
LRRLLSWLHRAGIALPSSLPTPPAFGPNSRTLPLALSIYGPTEAKSCTAADAGKTLWNAGPGASSAGAREPRDAHRTSAVRAGVAPIRDVYFYFDNTDKVKAPTNAL